MHRCVAKCSGSVPSGNIAKVHNVKWIHTEFRKHLILTKKEGRISLKKRISLLVMLFISILAVTGCRAKEAADSLEISFKDYEFGDVDRICLGFEMQSAYIKSEPAIALFQELISEVSGSHGTSSQGYADGGYSISMMSGEKEVFRRTAFSLETLIIRSIRTGMSMRLRTHGLMKRLSSSVTCALNGRMKNCGQGLS